MDIRDIALLAVALAHLFPNCSLLKGIQGVVSGLVGSSGGTGS